MYISYLQTSRYIERKTFFCHYISMSRQDSLSTLTNVQMYVHAQVCGFYIHKTMDICIRSVAYKKARFFLERDQQIAFQYFKIYTTAESYSFYN